MKSILCSVPPLLIFAMWKEQDAFHPKQTVDRSVCLDSSPVPTFVSTTPLHNLYPMRCILRAASQEQQYKHRRGRLDGEKPMVASGGAPSGEEEPASPATAIAAETEEERSREPGSAAIVGSTSLTKDPALHADPSLPGVFADDNRVAPARSEDGKRSDYNCGGGTKRRSRGVKQVKAWVSRAGSESRDSNAQIGTTTPSKAATAAGGHNKRIVLRNLRSYSSGFLPYDLNRPVSPERTLAFSYTCN